MELLLELGADPNCANNGVSASRAFTAPGCKSLLASRCVGGVVLKVEGGRAKRSMVQCKQVGAPAQGSWGGHEDPASCGCAAMTARRREGS